VRDSEILAQLAATAQIQANFEIVAAVARFGHEGGVTMHRTQNRVGPLQAAELEMSPVAMGVSESSRSPVLALKTAFGRFTFQVPRLSNIT